MKARHSFLAIFSVVLLFSSFAVAGDGDFWSDLAKGVLKGMDEAAKEDAKKKREEEFNKKLDGLLKKLPSSAKVAVLEITMKAPEFETPESDPSTEDSRIKAINTLKSATESQRDSLEEYIGDAGITVLDRDAFKEIEKEIAYSQTGEVDSRNSAKFGKAIGATHLIFCKTVYDGFKTGHPKATFSVKITEVESSKRVGTANFSMEIEQPKEAASSQSVQKQTLVDESFNVGPGTHQVYSWTFNMPGSLDISLNANSDVFLYVVDNENYAAYSAGRAFRGYAIKERVTSANFSVAIPKGLNYIVINNTHSVFTSAGVGLTVLFTPKQ